MMEVLRIPNDRESVCPEKPITYDIPLSVLYRHKYRQPPLYVSFR